MHIVPAMVVVIFMAQRYLLEVVVELVQVAIMGLLLIPVVMVARVLVRLVCLQERHP
jgi:hypothetical protein